MSAPTPVPGPGSPGKKPVLVVSGYSRRDLIFGIFLAIAVLGFIVFAVIRTGSEKSPNLLTGTVEGHYQTGEKETLLNVSRKGVNGKTADTGYYVKVRVPAEGKTYDVMVSEADWNRHKIGATINFIRPPSEQR